jgi:hypothetical protein
MATSVPRSYAPARSWKQQSEKSTVNTIPCRPARHSPSSSRSPNYEAIWIAPLVMPAEPRQVAIEPTGPLAEAAGAFQQTMVRIQGPRPRPGDLPAGSPPGKCGSPRSCTDGSPCPAAAASRRLAAVRHPASFRAPHGAQVADLATARTGTEGWTSRLRQSAAASRGLLQDGGLLSLIKLERGNEPGRLLSAAMTQGRELAVIASQDIQRRQQRGLAGVIRPGDQYQAGCWQVHIGATEGPEVSSCSRRTRIQDSLAAGSVLSPELATTTAISPDGSYLDRRPKLCEQPEGRPRPT